MPLSVAAQREPLHLRQISCQGFRRQDGMIDIEGHLVDTRPYAFFNDDKQREIPSGEPLHEMWLRLTIDTQMLVHAVEAVTDASPFAICSAITPNFQRLVGLKIGAGWRRAVLERLGGIEGCTHLVELLWPMATTAFQTMTSNRRQSSSKSQTPASFLLNTCHAYRSDSEVVQRKFPELYTGKGDKAVVTE